MVCGHWRLSIEDLEQGGYSYVNIFEFSSLLEFQQPFKHGEHEECSYIFPSPQVSCSHGQCPCGMKNLAENSIQTYPIPRWYYWAKRSNNRSYKA